jgi:hypothetical protein
VLQYISTWAHLTQGVKVKIEPKSSNPIGAATKISLKGFAVKVKAKLEYNVLIHDCLAL